MLKNYTVLEANMGKLDAMITKINKRAKKINQPEISYVIDKEYFVDLNKNNKYSNTENIVKFYNITLTAEPVEITGYTILASINHTYATGNIIKTLSNIEIPEKYKTIDGICEHCHTNRNRKETVLLQDAEGKIIQVGKSCLKDYLGYDINNQLSYMDLLTEIEGMELENISCEDGVKFTKYIGTTKLLQITNLLIKNYGYVKTKNEYDEVNSNSTKASALRIYYKNNFESWDDIEKEIYKKVINTTSYIDAEVTEAIEWIKKQENTSDYINNLQVLAKEKYINYKETGILCSLMVCYHKATEKQKVKEAKQAEQEKETESIKNEYVGTVGEKIQTELILKNEFVYETQWGISRIYIFADAEGHEYKWNSNKHLDKNNDNGKCEVYEKGEKVVLKGTIKAQEEYKGTKQTILTRCKVVE